jgi:hypothetical protein
MLNGKTLRNCPWKGEQSVWRYEEEMSTRSSLRRQGHTPLRKLGIVRRI